MQSLLSSPFLPLSSLHPLSSFSLFSPRFIPLHPFSLPFPLLLSLPTSTHSRKHYKLVWVEPTAKWILVHIESKISPLATVKLYCFYGCKHLELD